MSGEFRGDFMKLPDRKSLGGRERPTLTEGERVGPLLAIAAGRSLHRASPVHDL